MESLWLLLRQVLAEGSDVTDREEEKFIEWRKQLESGKGLKKSLAGTGPPHVRQKFEANGCKTQQPTLDALRQIAARELLLPCDERK